MRPNIRCDLVNGPSGDPVVYADVMFERRALLFDIGDIAALSPRQILRVTHIFVSHTHLDHFAGFDRLLRLMLGRPKTIAMYGPSGFIDRVEHKLRAYTWNVIRNYTGNLTFDVHELDGFLHRARFQSREDFRREEMSGRPLQDNVLATCGSLEVRCSILDHGTPCIGFALEEPEHVNIWKTRLDELGLTVGPWLRELKHAVMDGASDDTPIVTPGRLLPLRALRDVARVVAGQKIAYIVDVRGDTANVEKIERLVANADTLFIECAFLQEDLAHASRKNHLTALQAGEIARRARVKQLVPCHFSARYNDGGEALALEALAAFETKNNVPPAVGNH